MENKVQRKSFFGVGPAVLIVILIVIFTLSNKPVLANTITSFPSAPEGGSNITFDKNGTFYIASNHIEKCVNGTNCTIIDSVNPEHLSSNIPAYSEYWSIATDSNNNLWVLSKYSSVLKKYDGSNWTTIGNLGNAKGMTIDSSNNVYTVGDSNIIKKYDGSTWTDVTNGGNFSYPQGIAVYNDKMYVLDNNGIQKYDGSVWTTIGVAGTGPGTNQFYNVDDLVVDTSGNLYVADVNNNNFVRKYDGNQWTVVSTDRGTGLGQFSGASSRDGLAFYNGFLYAVDIENMRLQKYDGSNWSLVQYFNTDPGEFRGPQQISATNGNVYVADFENNRIQKYDGNNWSVISNGLGSSTGQVNNPEGVAADVNGNVYVADTLNHRIQKYNGSSWSVISNDNSGTAGNFWFPNSVAIDANGNVYVTDNANNTVQRYNGSTWTIIGSKSAGTIDSPYSASIDKWNNVYVGDDNTVKKFDGTNWTTIVSSLPGSYHQASDITTVDPDGNIYVVNNVDRSLIYKYSNGNWVVLNGDTLYGIESLSFDENKNLWIADYQDDRIEKISNPVIFRPSIPTGLSTTGNNGQISLSWSAPTDNGGAEITDYQIQYGVLNTNGTCNSWTTYADGVSTSTSAVITGLNSGTNYAFKVTAINAEGLGIESDVTNYVAPKAPGIITGLTTTIGNKQMTLSWSAPTDNGGTEITDYQIQYKLTSESDWTVFADETSPDTGGIVTGLTNGTSYDFRVNAVNSIGPGINSDVVSATPATTPGSPTQVKALPENGEIILSWTTPTDNGGATITKYQTSYKKEDGSWSDYSDVSSGNTKNIDGLENGYHYSVRVRAVNIIGGGTVAEATAVPVDFTNPEKIVAYPAIKYSGPEIAIDRDGNMYVGGDLKSNLIQKYDGQNWSVIGIGGTGSPGQFYLSHGMTTDTQGNLYVTDSGNNRIQKYDIGTTSWSVIGNGETIGLATDDVNLRGVAVDTNGNIYAADDMTDDIEKYDIGTTSWSVIGNGGSIGGPVGQFNNPRDMAADTNGNIYVVDMNNSRIQKYDGHEWTALGVGGTGGPGQLDNPQGVATDTNGNVYVADTMNHRIQKYDVETATWTLLGIGGTGDDVGKFDIPESVAVDKNNNVYVTDLESNRVQKYDGHEWTIYVDFNKLGLNHPFGVTTDVNGNMYVADSWNARIQKYDIGTTSWSTLLTVDDRYGNDLAGITTDPKGNVYITEETHNQIQKYDVGTTSWSVIGIGGTGGPGQFSWPADIASDINGNIYVADGGNQRIQKYDIGTTSWSVIGLGETLKGTPIYPDSIATDISGNIYTASSITNQIQKYDVGTTSWSNIGIAGTKAPTKITTDVYGNIYGVSSFSANQIEKYDVGTTSWSVMGTGGTGVDQFYWPEDVAIDTNGNIYVADELNDQIKKLIYWKSEISSTPIVPIVPTVPGIPAELAATPGNGQIALSWTAPTDNGGKPVTDYQIQYKPTSEDAWTTYADGVSTNTNGVVTGLVDGTSYDFRVNAVNSIGPGTNSDAVSATPTAVVPGVPTEIGVGGGNKQVVLSWTAPTDNGGAAITNYRIQYKLENDSSWTNFNHQPTNETGITVTGLNNDEIYKFRIQAINSVGAGEYSDEVTGAPRISIDATDISSLIDDNVYVAATGTSLTETPKVTVTNSVSIMGSKVSSGDGYFYSSVIALAKDTEIIRLDGQSLDVNQISEANMDKNNVSNLTAGFNPQALMQWGIPGVTLVFSQPVQINMYVGADYNGQTLTVLRSPSVSTGWTTEGLVSSTCVVSNGTCNFSTNEASYFTVASYQAPANNNQSNSSSNNSSSGGNGPQACTDVAPTDKPDLFEMKTNKGKVKLIYTPSSRATAYAVMYGLKKGDERFGTIINTVNNNKGVQNADIMALNSKTTYYFKVAAINGCTISPWSDWVPVKADKTKTVYKYKTMVLKGIKMLINQYLK
jgi:DNA-binding beta-propeller fold protein YncE